MKISVYLFVLGLSVLSACTPKTAVRDDLRGPVRDPGTETTRAATPDNQRASAESHRATVGQQSAVRTLMQHARRHAEEGNTAKAAVALERALRIDPYDAVLWNNLAEVRYKQNQLQLAESLALKSISYAKQDKELITRNWKLIAEARSLRGDAAGANEAARKVEGR